MFRVFGCNDSFIYFFFLLSDKLLAIIDVYRERQDRFDNPQQPGNKHHELFREMAEEMALRHNTPMTTDEVRDAWNKLVTKYTDLAKKELVSGNGSVRWPYYDIMHSFLRHRTNIVPPVYASVGIHNEYRTKSDDKENTPDKTSKPRGRVRTDFTQTPLKKGKSEKVHVFRSPLMDFRQRELKVKEDMLSEFIAMRREVSRRNDIFDLHFKRN